ncbi:MAG: hypothetical protein OXI87_11295 [Albidovulum sp.]|nr:hypothetical protein [Albidovulum sp.]
MKPYKYIRKWNQCIIVFASAVTVLAFVVGVLKYGNDVKNRNFDRTYTYYQYYQSEDYNRSTETLDKALKKAFDVDPNSNVRNLEENVKRVVKDSFREYNAEIIHFNLACQCIKSFGCDKTILIDLFRSRPDNIITLIFPAFQNKFKKNKKHGIGLLCLSNRDDLWDKIKKPADEQC